MGIKQRLTVTRRLIAQGQLLVKPGQKVEKDTIVGKLDYIPGQIVRCNVADQLGIAPKYIHRKIVQDVNDWVDKGDILARNDECFFETTIQSPTSGYVALISKFLGNVFIREPLPAGPKEPIWLRAEDFGLSKLAFAAGTTIKQGTVVDKGRVLVTSKPPILAPAVGRIREISVNGGYIILAPLYQVTELYAHLNGTVVDQPDSSTLVIQGYGYRYPGVIGYGGEQIGILEAVSSKSEDIDVLDLPSDMKGKILIARGGITLEALRVVEKAGIKGLILGTIKPHVLKEYSREDILTVMGSRMDLPFTIILMQGFGSAMSETLYQELTSHQGLSASIDGSTQLRAGVVRPEILIALEEDEPQQLDPVNTDRNLHVNDFVQLIREPHFGATGRVIQLRSELQPTEAGTMAALVNIQLENGSSIQVPVQNCQKIGGAVS